jgi:hypothetical protein
MVSEKVIVILIIVAILLSILSVVITMASIKAPELKTPQVVIQTGEVVPDDDEGVVGLSVNKLPSKS